MEESHFFSQNFNEERELPPRFSIDSSVDIASLPVVVVLDSGIVFPESLEPLVMQHWSAEDPGNGSHGTSVAGKVIFGNIAEAYSESIVLTPRARVIDCNIINGKTSFGLILQRIKLAVDAFSGIAKIFNLSMNITTPIEGDRMSMLGYELDCLQTKYGIQFVISAGNHLLSNSCQELSEILDDDDTRIAEPADSMLGITVGAAVGESYANDISSKNKIAPFSRRGPGLAGFLKPDLSAFSGTILKNQERPHDQFTRVISNSGNLTNEIGTSFTAPYVSGCLAQILAGIPNEDILLAKALLYHEATPLWDPDNVTEEELETCRTLLGRGVPNVEESLFSSTSKVTFVRTGVMNPDTKNHVKIFMPQILAQQGKRNGAKVRVTCVYIPSVGINRGTNYTGARICANLKKCRTENDSQLLNINKISDLGRKKWDACYQYEKTFSRFNSGDWEIWMELFSRWERAVDVPYALVVTIEDLSASLDIYTEIQNTNRYQSFNALRVQMTDPVS